MEIKNKEVFISDKKEDNPFENCLLNREQYARVLTSIISSYNEGFVLAINNEWGTGKTTFVKMWQKHLEQKSCRTIYFNAWENDFQNEVIIAILAELQKLQDDSKLFKKVLEKAVPLLKNVGLEFIKHAVGKVTGDKAVEILTGGIVEHSPDSLQKSLDDFEIKKESIQEFKNCLTEFVNSVDNENPIIFIIDELDRCRPNYAVEVLEKMKHLFNVKGVVFVLSIDKVQLGHAIRGVYGSEQIDSDEYLRRFIDIEFSLPKPDIKDYTIFLIKHFGLHDYYTNSRRKNIKVFESELKDLKFIIDLTLTTCKPTLRQLEKILGLSSLAVKSMTPNQYANPMCVIFIVFLKIINKDGFYEKFIDRKLTLQELLDKTLDLFYPLEDSGMTNPFLWFQSEIIYYYWIYLKEKDNSIILYTGDTNDESFEITLENKVEDQYNNLSSGIHHLASNHSKKSLNIISVIIPHIELTKIVT